jgi:hypothetical protein
LAPRADELFKIPILTDNKVAQNIADVDTLNAQLVGPSGIVSKLPPNHPMSV